MSEMWRVLLLEESSRGGTGKRTEFGGFCGLGDGGERGKGKGERGKGREIPRGRCRPESNPESGIRFSVAYTLWPPPGPNLRHEPEQRAGRSTTSLRVVESRAVGYVWMPRVNGGELEGRASLFTYSVEVAS